MVILDGRSVQARLLALAERVERVRERMKLVGITIRTLTQHSRLAESTIEDLLNARIMDERKLEKLELTLDDLGA